jgi:hypothetical protein
MTCASISYDGGHGWPKYGLVPLTRCPNCPWLEPLVRLRCKRGTTKKCTFFIWIEDYIEKLQSDGMLKGARIMGESQEMVVSN